MAASADYALLSPRNYKDQLKKVRNILKGRNMIFTGTDVMYLGGIVFGFLMVWPNMIYHFISSNSMKHYLEKFEQILDDEYFAPLLASPGFVAATQAYFGHYLPD